MSEQVTMLEPQSSGSTSNLNKKPFVSKPWRAALRSGRFASRRRRICKLRAQVRLDAIEPSTG